MDDRWAATECASELLRAARALVDVAAAAGVSFAQVFAESSCDLRVETIDGVRSGLMMLPRAGVGCTVRIGSTWRHQHAPLAEIDDLVAWLRALGRDGTAGSRPPLRCPAVAVEPVPVARLRAQLVPVSAWGAVVGGAGPPVSLRCTEDITLCRFAVADTEGRFAVDIRPAVRRRVEAVATGPDGPCRGWARATAPPGDGAIGAAGAGKLAAEAASTARAMARARPAGRRHTPVVFGPGAGAAFLHELVGHALEDDNLVAGSSYTSRLPGSVVAPPQLTVYDDPGLPGGYGSLRVDDEGTPGQRTDLLTGGAVGSPLTSLRSITRSGAAPSGNGRREAYWHPTLPRATNTVVEAGPDQPDQLADASAGEVLYVRSLASGEINLVRGEFWFAALESVLLTPGGNAVPVRDVTIVGDALAALSRIEGVASDLGSDNVTCGKQGQSVGIGLFSPTMRFGALPWRSA